MSTRPDSERLKTESRPGLLPRLGGGGATEAKCQTAAADSYSAHLRAISTLLLDTLHHVNVLQEEARDRKIGQTEVAGMERAREFTVEAAWALGAITSKEAKAKHGVGL